MDIRELIDKKRLSKVVARKVAASQFDLGDVTKNQMVEALSNPVVGEAYVAFLKMDELSQRIVRACLDEEDDFESRISRLNYELKCFTEAYRAIPEA